MSKAQMMLYIYIKLGKHIQVATCASPTQDELANGKLHNTIKMPRRDTDMDTHTCRQALMRTLTHTTMPRRIHMLVSVSPWQTVISRVKGV